MASKSRVAPSLSGGCRQQPSEERRKEPTPEGDHHSRLTIEVRIVAAAVAFKNHAHSIGDQPDGSGFAAQ
jgi:hypothetical protein